MKSIKPGRGPSKLGAVGSIFIALFGVFWCILACSIGGWFMLPFGILFVGFAIYQGFFHYHNATSDNRYSIMDIVDSEEESDPLNQQYGHDRSHSENDIYGTSAEYCPYCGKIVKDDFEFCPGCGRKLPD